MNVIIGENLYDKDYVAKYTVGFEKLKEHVKKYTPEWAEKETEVPASVIVETARLMGKNKPSVLIHPGRHTAWYEDNTQMRRAIAILMALLGAYGRPGGMYLPPKNPLPSYGLSDFCGLEYPPHEKPEINKGKFSFVEEEGIIPEIIKVTLSEDPYPIKGWFVTGTNLIKSTPNQRDTVKAIDKLDLLVVVDMMPFDIVLYADVVLPECTYLERYDDLFEVRESSLGLALRQPVIPPMYETKPGWWIAKELAKKIGLERYFPYENFEDYLKAKCEALGVNFEELKTKGYLEIPDTANPYIDEKIPLSLKLPQEK